MRRISAVLAALPAALLLAVVALPGAALAHERREIGGGKYVAVVGWDVEPAFQNQPNAAGIRILRNGTEEGVEGLDKTLTLQVAFGGGQPKPFALQSAFRDPGYYKADIVPTREGTYIFTLSGSIEGANVNETFESGPGRFDDIESTRAVQFPEPMADPSAAIADAQAARAEAGSARTLGIAGIVVGGLGLLAALASFALRRSPAAAPAPRTVADERRV